MQRLVCSALCEPPCRERQSSSARPHNLLVYGDLIIALPAIRRCSEPEPIHLKHLSLARSLTTLADSVSL